MSKKLLKIISICAFVVMLPVVILGVAMAASTNKGVTLTVFDGGDSTTEEGWSSAISISVNNVKQDSNKITVKKGTEVTVSWEGVGYEFEGWFEGNESEIQEKNIKESSVTYAFKLDNNAVLTGVKSFLSLNTNDASIKYNPNTKKFDELNPSRENYTFVGLRYENNIYRKTTDGDYIQEDNNSKLSDAIVAKGTSLDVTEVWKVAEGYYGALNIKVSTKCVIDQKSYSVYGIDAEGKSTKIKDLSEYFAFDEFGLGENYGEATNINEIMTNVLLNYHNFYVEIGGETKEVAWINNKTNFQVQISYPETGNVSTVRSATMSTDSTFVNLIDLVKLEEFSFNASSDIIQITFIFEEVNSAEA